MILHLPDLLLNYSHDILHHFCLAMIPLFYQCILSFTATLNVNVKEGFTDRRERPCSENTMERRVNTHKVHGHAAIAYKENKQNKRKN